MSLWSAVTAFLNVPFSSKKFSQPPSVFYGDIITIHICQWSPEAKLWWEVEIILQRCLVWCLGSICPCVLFNLWASCFYPLLPSFLPPPHTARCWPCSRASMKVRRGLLIIADYRNIGLSWWDQPVALQGGDEAKAGGGKELQLKLALITVSWSISCVFFFF